MTSLALVPKSSYPLTVGSLDSETYALDNDAVVIEVAVARVTLSVNPEYLAGSEITDSSVLPLTSSQPEKFIYRFNVLDQLARGRVFNPDTYVFHLNQQLGFGGLYDMVAEGLRVSPAQTIESLADIQKRLEPCEEIWINGLSFDPPVLGSLAKAYDFSAGFGMSRLWSHQKERDIRTIRKTFHLGSSETPAAHRAMEDTLWNLEVVYQFHQRLAALNAPRYPR